MNKSKIAVISARKQELLEQIQVKEYGIAPFDHVEMNLRAADMDLPDLILIDGRDNLLSETLGACSKIRSCHSKSFVFLLVIVKKAGDGLELMKNGLDDFVVCSADPAELQVRIARGLLQAKARNSKADRLDEHNKLADMLIQKEEEIQAVMNAAADPIVVYNMTGEVEFVNEAFTRIFGWTQEELLGRRIDFVPDDQKEATSEQVRQILAGEIRTGFESRRYTKSKELLDVLISANLYCHDGQPHGMVVTFHDITRQKENMESLKKVQAMLVQSDKMASIGQLAAGVAHEINNPMGFISSNIKTMGEYGQDLKTMILKYQELCNDVKQGGLRQSELLGEIGRLEEKIDIDYLTEDMTNLLSECREGAERVKKIVMDLKDFSHPGEENKVACDINAGIESTVNVVWNEIKYKAEVIKNYGDLPYIDAYPQQLNQVFMNLLVNAAQAIPARGEIRITTRVLDKEIEVEIADTGSGIPAENISKMFDPFFTTKEIGKGTGLGLNIAYQIIENHNGRIQVDSKVGEGTVFRIYLPVQD